MSNKKYSEYKKDWYKKNKERILKKRADNVKHYSKKRMEYYHKNKKLVGKVDFFCIFCDNNVRIYNKMRHLKSKKHKKSIYHKLYFVSDLSKKKIFI